MIEGEYRLRQIPEISGAMAVMDPHTGRVLAMVGGFSFEQSQFNRATQALRQPGSSFKPIVYAAAIDNGYTPSTIILDAPIEIDIGTAGIWKPENYGGQFYGPSTLRFGLEESRNVMTVRLAQDIGMPLIAEYAKKFGVYDQLPPYLSYALGAGETTLMRMVTAYSMIDNGGRRVIPTLIDRIQDRYGHTILQARQARMRRLQGQKLAGSAGADADRSPREGARSDDRLSDHLDDGGRGPARHRDGASRRRQADRGQNRHHQRQQGRLVHRFFARHRLRRLHGLRQAEADIANATGGNLAAPIVRDFFKVALTDKPPIPFPCRRASSWCASMPRPACAPRPGDNKVILEAFKPGTAPPDSYSVIGADNTGGPMPARGPGPVSPDADRAIRSNGTGGLY